MAYFFLRIPPTLGIFTGNESTALVSPGMTELYFDHEDASSDADVLVLCCSLFLAVDCNSLWLHTGLVWFHTGTPDKAGYHPVLLSVFCLEQAST